MPGKDKRSSDRDERERRPGVDSTRSQPRQRVVVVARQEIAPPIEPRYDPSRRETTGQDVTNDGRTSLPPRQQHASYDPGYTAATDPSYGSRQYYAAGEPPSGPRDTIQSARSDPNARPPREYHSSRTTSDHRRVEISDPDQQNPDASGVTRVESSRARPPAEDDSRRPPIHRGTGVRSSRDEVQSYVNPTASTPINIPQGGLADPQYDDLSTRSRPTFGASYSGGGQYGSARSGTADNANIRWTSGGYSQPTTAAPANTANTAATRTQRPPPSEPPRFESVLSLQIRFFANLPRGRLENVFRHLRENLWLLKEDPEPLLQEAVQAFTYYYAWGETRDGSKSEYAENCIQQCILLKMLQAQLRNSRRSTKSFLDDFEDDLFKKGSELQRRFYQGMDKAREIAKTQAQARKPRAPANTASSPPNHPPSRRDPSDQGGGAGAYSSQQTQATTASNVSHHVPSGHSPPDQRGTTAGYGLQSPGITSGLAAMTIQPTSVYASAMSGPMTTSRAQQNTTGGPPPINRSSSLDSTYQVRSPEFYRPGRVFSVLQHDSYNGAPRSENADSRQTDNFSIGRYGEKIYSSIRRMVVIRRDHGFAVCIPISTYGGRGLRKYKNPQDIEAHAQIYMDGEQPEWLPQETQSSKRAIAVTKASPDKYLTPASRICFSQPHTVQFNTKTSDVGFVTDSSLVYLLHYFKLSNGFSN